MRVDELIEELQKLPQEAEVVVTGYDKDMNASIPYVSQASIKRLNSSNGHAILIQFVAGRGISYGDDMAKLVVEAFDRA